MNTTSGNPDSVSRVNMTPIKPMVGAIGDGAVVVERGEDVLDGDEKGIKPTHVQEGLLLAGERRLREILGGGRRADGDRDIRARLAIKLTVSRYDGLFKVCGERRSYDPAPDHRAGFCEGLDIINVESGQGSIDPVGKPLVL